MLVIIIFHLVCNSMIINLYSSTPIVCFFINIYLQCRRKKNNKGKLAILKRHQLCLIKNTIAPYYLETNPTLHCTIEFSTREVERMRCYTIHLEDLSFANDKEYNTILSTYKNVVYDCGVKFKPKHYEELNCIKRYNLINLHRMTKNYISITANKHDCIENYDDVIAVPSSYRQSSIDK